jgi:hypothetical protein
MCSFWESLEFLCVSRPPNTCAPPLGREQDTFPFFLSSTQDQVQHPIGHG